MGRLLLFLLPLLLLPPAQLLMVLPAMLLLIQQQQALLLSPLPLRLLQHGRDTETLQPASTEGQRNPVIRCC